MLTIRQAKQSDCDAMCAVHRAAIVHHYRSSMGEDAARQSSNLLHADICQQWLANEMVIVAEENGAVLAFAQFNGDTGYLEVSATPEAEQRAIPAALLAVIETEARGRGVDALKLSAMPGSEHLYTPAGFVLAGRGELALADSSTLPCVKLQKVLQYAEPRPERRRNGSVPAGPTLT